MHYKITITDPRDNFGNPLTKLANSEYETREDACEVIFFSLLDHIKRFGCEMVEKSECADYGALYVCDNHGMNAVPHCPEEEPYSREEAYERLENDGNITELHEAIADDNCTADVDFVSVNDEGEMCYYQFVSADYADVCRAFIMRNGYATDDGVTATVEEVVE